jgi:hypothetical protein
VNLSAVRKMTQLERPTLHPRKTLVNVSRNFELFCTAGHLTEAEIESDGRGTIPRIRTLNFQDCVSLCLLTLSVATSVRIPFTIITLYFLRIVRSSKSTSPLLYFDKETFISSSQAFHRVILDTKKNKSEDAIIPRR